MTVALVIFISFVVALVTAYSTQRGFRALGSRKEQPLLLGHAKDTNVEMWRKVFRETVVAAEGRLSPEIEEMLSDDRLDALVQLEVEANRTLSNAKAEADRILAEANRSLESERSVVQSEKEAILSTARAEAADILSEARLRAEYLTLAGDDEALAKKIRDRVMRRYPYSRGEPFPDWSRISDEDRERWRVLVSVLKAEFTKKVTL